MRHYFLLLFFIFFAEPALAWNNNYYQNHNSSYSCVGPQNNFSRAEWELQKWERIVENLRQRLDVLLQRHAAASADIDCQIESLQLQIAQLEAERAQLISGICQTVPQCHTCNDYRRVQSRYNAAIRHLQRRMSQLNSRRSQSLRQLDSHITRAQLELDRAEQILVNVELKFELASEKLAVCLASCNY